jgi:HEPN domain-containing protein
VASREQDWLDQARWDLGHAGRALDDQDFEWACFAAQQAAEKAVKAVYQRHGGEAWGHAVSVLLQGLEGFEVPGSLLDSARELDQHYVPTRYPNAHPEGAPHAFYTQRQAERAVGYAEEIIAWCEGLLAR